MKALLGLLLGCLAACSAGAAWPDELTATRGEFPPYRPFHAHYKFGWKMFTAAEADVDYVITKLGTAQLTAAAHSTGVVRGMWRMDAQHFATMDPATLRPLAVAQTESYKNETITTKLLFTPEGVERTRLSTIPSDKAGKVKRFKMPQAMDLQSAVQFLRTQRLQNGDQYKVVVYPAAAAFLAQITVVEHAKVHATGQQWNAIKLDLRLWRINKDLQLEAHEKFKRASIWLSDDTDRVVLRAESEIHVGATWCELEHIDWK